MPPVEPTWSRRVRTSLVPRMVATLGLITALWLGGCGGDKTSAATTPVDGSSTSEVEGDDLGSSTDGTTFDLAFDGSQGVCPGAAGCACQDNAECNIGFCLETPKGRRCASYCDQTCGADSKCANVPVGNDVISMCIPRWGRLCEPCLDSAMCRAALGSDDAACVEYGGLQGAFCGAACTADGDCPGGYTCAAGTSVEGKDVKQCRKVAESDGSIQCPCDVRAVEQALATSCAATAVQGTCPGTRTCSAKGLTACTAAPASAETCNGVDDDCNGLTDDGLCDDKNPCTDDVCDAKAGSCQNAANVLPCSDGNACTDKDTCSNGQCAGQAADCDDKNPCTSDTCDGKLGCQHALADNGACEDGNACTIGDLCLGGQCQPGKVKDCGDSNACTVDLCDSVTGTCAHKAQDGQPCSDGNACTDPDLCMVDTCQGKLKDCNDLNPCTDDSCDVAVGCVNVPTSKPCNDSNACTNSDQCDGKGACVGQAIDVSATCSDNNVCTGDSCDSGVGCVHSPQASTCEDGNPCTNGDSCTAGVCVPGGNICSCQGDGDCAGKEDGDLCNGTLYCDKAAAPYVCKVDPATVVFCDTSGDSTCTKTTCAPKTGKCGSVSQPDAKPCDADTSVCTVGDTCQGGVCTAGPALGCDDKNPCTDDLCDAKLGCKNIANVAACSDGNACTVGDTCGSGSCVAGKKTVCDDGSDCTQDSCDVKTGSCVFDGSGQEGDPCDADGSVCTVGDKCAAGVCKTGPGKNCDDQNECTSDSCDAKSGCLHVNNADPCDFDGSPCTPTDVCKNGNCAPGPKKDCDDQNVCTIDACNPSTGDCTHEGSALDDKACEDGSLCTVGDKCKGGACLPGAVTSCDDAEPCTTDSCDKLKGCLHAQAAVGSACNDGSACTQGDVCGVAKCAGSVVNCDDANPCTVDSCSPSTGCAHAALSDTTAVSGSCDAAKYCVGGKCVVKGCGDGYLNGGEQCDDGNASACDGCESCQTLGVLTLDGKGYATASAQAGPPGTLTGALGLEQDLTLEAWVKPTDFATQRPIAGKTSGTGKSSWRFGMQATSGLPYFGHDESTAEVVTGTTAVQAGVWSHVAVVVAGVQVRFYVNGKPAGQATLTQERHDLAGTLVVVGAAAATASGPSGAMFLGSLDAVHVSSTSLYGGPFVPARRPVATGTSRALWLFDEGKGTTTADSSGLGNTLTLGGTAAFAGDTCYGAPADAAVCGDGKIAAAFESCDDGNGTACDGCEGCRALKELDGASKGALQLPVLSSWAADTTCDTCALTAEAWVKLSSTSTTQEIFSSSCGFLSVHLFGGKFGIYRQPEPLVTGTTAVVANKWYHVAAVVGMGAGSEIRLYVNGHLEGSVLAGNVAPAALPKEIAWFGAGVGPGGGSGCKNAGDTVVPGGFLTGSLDEARVSQGARYTDDFVPARRLLPDRQTRGLWHLDDAPATSQDDSGAGVATVTLGVSSYGADQCYLEPANLVTCGDGAKARWEGCDNGAIANGDYPKACSGGCTPAFDPDCTALSWSAGQAPVGTKKFLSYPSSLTQYPGWTFEGWVRLPEYPKGSYGIIAGVDPHEGCSSMPTGQDWAIAVAPDGADASYLASGSKGLSSKALHVWKVGVWQHVALQIDSPAHGSLYVDGVKVRDFVVSQTAWDSTCPLRLGNAVSTQGSWPAAAQVASLRLSKVARYGQTFTPAWTLGADAKTLWAFQMDSATGNQASTPAGFEIDPQGATALGTAGPACNK